MHPMVKLANEVLAGDYPSTMVSWAQFFIKQHTEHRNHIKWLWGNRSMLRTHTQAMNESRAKGSNSRLMHSRYASRVMQRLYGPDQLSPFHSAYGRLLKFDKENASMFHQFKAMHQLVHEQNVSLVLSYIEHVNAQRYDSEGTLAPVAYLRWIAGPLTSEVLAWRLMKNA